MTVSWVEQFRRVEGFGNLIDSEKSSGIGDLVFLGKYRLTDPSKNSALFIGSGVKLPTGDTEQTNDNGIVLSLDMQPGSGAIDGLFWLYYSGSFFDKQTATFFSSNLFQLTGWYNEFNRIQKYKVGNNLVSRAGITNNLTFLKQLFDTSFELIFRRNWKDEVNDQLIPNTGGSWFFIKPSLSLIVSQNISINLGLELPLYSNVIGEQLTSNNRLTFQFISKFGQKQKDLF